MAQLTKTAIMDAFVRLLEQTPMDQITVQAITAQCGISRNTFYYHYSDVYALLKAVLQRDMDMLLASGVRGSTPGRACAACLSTCPPGPGWCSTSTVPWATPPWRST